MKPNMQDDKCGKFWDITKSVVPVPELLTADVDLSLNDGTIKVYAEQEHMLLSMCQGAEVPPVEDLLQLFYDLLYLRASYVRGARLPFSIRGTRFVIPSFLSCIINALGRVESDEFGLILTPNVPKPIVDKGTIEERSMEEITEEVIRISRLFRPFYDMAGIEYATELPKPKEGDISLLLFDTTDNKVMAESKHAPGLFALMAAIVGLRQNKPIMVARVNYGSMEFYRYLTFHVGDYERRNN